MVVIAMHEDKLSYQETAKRFGLSSYSLLLDWERSYLKEGEESICPEGRRGKRKAEKAVEEKLLIEVHRLHAENAYLKMLARQGNGERTRAAEKARIIQKLREEYPLGMLLDIAQLARATFYYQVKKMNKTDKYTAVKEEIREIFHENKGRYGYRRITTELRIRGKKINHKTVRRLMKEEGLVCRVRMKKYRSYKGETGKIAPNLLDRDFNAEKPNQKWVTDVTEFRMKGQKLYLSAIIDLHSRDVVSYALSERAELRLVTTMLERAFEKLGEERNLILHSDQGWQYQHAEYREMLEKKGIRQSMSRKGNCLDNAVIENFFGIVKSELNYEEEYETMEELKEGLKEYLEYYNKGRIKEKLKGKTPARHREEGG